MFFTSDSKPDFHKIQFELRNTGFFTNGIIQPAGIILFPENEEDFIEKSTAQGISDYVSIYKKAILNSANEWKKLLLKGVKTILGWLQNDPKNAKPIKCTVHRHCNCIIQNSHKYN